MVFLLLMYTMLLIILFQLRLLPSSFLLLCLSVGSVDLFVGISFTVSTV